MTNYVSAFNFGSENIEIQAAKVEWDALTGITAASDSSATSGIMTPDQIQSLISDKTTKVYHVKGSKTVAGINALSESDIEIGDVYNVSDSGEINIKPGDTSKTISVIAGDNVVYSDEGWDKLAGTIDLTSYATTAWVNSAANVTLTVSSTSGHWETAYDAITGAISTSGGMTANTVTSALATSNAISAYVSGTIANKLVDEITTSTPTDAIPDAKAVSAYVNDTAVLSAYSQINVYKTTTTTTPETTYATTRNDKFALSAGKGIKLDTTSDGDGNPTIVINNDATVDLPTIEATSGIAAEAKKDAAENITAYSISGIQATDSQIGVNYAPYYVGGVIYFNQAKA